MILKIKCNGMQVVMSEGFWGMIIYAIILPILNVVKINGIIIEPFNEFVY